MTEQLLDARHAGRLVIILFAHPFDATGFEARTLFEDGYHIASKQEAFEQVSLAGQDLVGTKLMLLETGHCLQRHALAAFPDLNFVQDETFAATSSTTLISMVSEGLGITL